MSNKQLLNPDTGKNKQLLIPDTDKEKSCSTLTLVR